MRWAYEAFNDGDPSVWLGLYDPDIVLVVAPGASSPEPGTYVGAAAVERWFANFFSPFGRSFHVDILEAIPVGDSVITLQRSIARGQASGVEVTAPTLASVVTFRGGRVVRIDLAENREAALQLVGPPAS